MAHVESIADYRVATEAPPTVRSLERVRLFLSAEDQEALADLFEFYRRRVVRPVLAADTVASALARLERARPYADAFLTAYLRVLAQYEPPVSAEHLERGADRARSAMGNRYPVAATRLAKSLQHFDRTKEWVLATLAEDASRAAASSGQLLFLEVSLRLDHLHSITLFGLAGDERSSARVVNGLASAALRLARERERVARDWLLGPAPSQTADRPIAGRVVLDSASAARVVELVTRPRGPNAAMQRLMGK